MSVLAKAWLMFVGLFIGGTILNAFLTTYLIGVVLGQPEVAAIAAFLCGLVVGSVSVLRSLDYYYSNKPFRLR